MAVFREAETLLIGEELPIVPIYFYVNGGFLRQNVRGFYTELESDSTVPAVNLKDVHPINAMYIEGKP
jgi:hypothetical protein